MLTDEHSKNAKPKLSYEASKLVLLSKCDTGFGKNCKNGSTDVKKCKTGSRF